MRGAIMRKATKDLIKWAAERGWDCEIRNGGHICFTREGRQVFASATPRNAWRSDKNTKAQIRRYERQDGMKEAVT
jgi:hypothetical protein